MVSYAKLGVPQAVLEKLVPLWAELDLPKACRDHTKQDFRDFNFSSTQDMGGPLGTLDSTGTIYTKSINNNVRKGRALSDTMNNFEEHGTYGSERSRKEAAADVSATDAIDNGPTSLDNMVLSREKRFLNGMTLGGPPGGRPKQEVSESAQLMKMFMLFSKLQNTRLKADLGVLAPSRTDFYGDRVSFGGLYGDQYMGRKKREAPVSPVKEFIPMADSSLSNAVDAESTVSRQKRFIFTEPGYAPIGVNPVNQMMRIILGTARDPNTGKKLEFGNDAMKNMIRQSYIQSMPASMRPPPGKEGEIVKDIAPLWYFSRLQRSLSTPAFARKDPGDYQPIRTSGYVQRRNRDGTFGDMYPRGKRKKRSSDDNSDSNNNNEVIKFGDMSIPLDFFKPAEQSEIQTPPPVTQRPIYYPVYIPTRRMTRPQFYNRQALPYYTRLMLMQRAAAARNQYTRRFSPTMPATNRFPAPAPAPTSYRPPLVPQQRFSPPQPPMASSMVPSMAGYPMRHGRKKRASDNGDNNSNNNDVLAVGDVSIPLDFFKRSDDYSQPQQTPAPRYIPYYKQVVYRQPVYINRYIPYYQHQRKAAASSRIPAQYYHRYAQTQARSNHWQRTNQVYPAFGQQWGVPQTPLANRWPQQQQRLPFNRLPIQPTPAPVQRWPQHVNQWALPPRQAPPQQAPVPHVSPQQPPNPFLPPVPPTPPNQPMPAHHRRVKRSDNGDKSDSSSSSSSSPILPFFPSPLFFPSSPLMSPWAPLGRFTNPKMMVSNSPTTGPIYGDRLPWASPAAPAYRMTGGMLPRPATTFGTAPAPRLTPFHAGAPTPVNTANMGPLDMIYGRRPSPMARMPAAPASFAPVARAQPHNPYSLGNMRPAQSVFNNMTPAIRRSPAAVPGIMPLRANSPMSQPPMMSPMAQAPVPSMTNPPAMMHPAPLQPLQPPQLTPISSYAAQPAPNSPSQTAPASQASANLPIWG